MAKSPNPRRSKQAKSVSADEMVSSTREDVATSGKHLTISLGLASLVVGAAGAIFSAIYLIFGHLNGEMAEIRRESRTLLAEQIRQAAEAKVLRERLDEMYRQLREVLPFPVGISAPEGAHPSWPSRPAKAELENR